MSDIVERLRLLPRIQVTAPHHQWTDRALECAKEAADEIDRLNKIVDAAGRWRRAFHHGTRNEIDLQEQCLLIALAEDC